MGFIFGIKGLWFRVSDLPLPVPPPRRHPAWLPAGVECRVQGLGIRA